jgi:Tol biopolymer transport system component
MKSSGEESRRLLAIQSGATFLQVAWAPDGERLAYLKNYSSKFERVIETCDLKGGQTGLIWSNPQMKSFCWTPRGSLIAALSESGTDTSTSPSHSDLWEVEVRRHEAASPPRRLTNFAGFTPISLSLTADGKKLALIRSYSQSDVWLGELDPGGEALKRPRRLTLDDRIDWPAGWTHDSKAVLFFSDRQGALDIFRQPVEARTADLVLQTSEEKRQPQLSPDGLWILYLAWSRTHAGASPSTGKIMRIPAAGGPPQPLLEVNGYPGSAQLPQELGTRVLTSAGNPEFRCPHRPGSLCVLSESDAGNKVVFYRFDPIRGNKSELVRVEAGGPSFWDLSPDGSQIAFGEVGRKDRIRILSAGTASEIPIKGFRTIASVGWSTDGESFFLTGTAPEGGSVLRHVFADGRGSVLYQADTWLEKPMPSPDGRYLVFGQATSSNNVWTIENFEPK